MKLNKKLLLVLTFSSLILASFLSVLLKPNLLNKSYSFDINLIKDRAIQEAYEFIDFGNFKSQKYIEKFDLIADSIDYFFLIDVKTNINKLNNQAKIDINEIKNKGTGTYYFLSEDSEIILEKFFNNYFNKKNYEFYYQLKYLIDENTLYLNNILDFDKEFSFKITIESFENIQKLIQVKQDLKFYTHLSGEIDKLIDQYDFKNQEEKDIIYNVKNLEYLNFLIIFMTLFLMTMISLCLVFYKKILNGL